MPFLGNAARVTAEAVPDINNQEGRYLLDLR